jgi:hypothetical protein
MKKQLTNKTIYVPNPSVKLTVTNKPIFDEEIGQVAGYDVDVTVKIKRNLMPQELKFGSDEDIAEFMGSVDFDDPQQELGFGK